MNDSKVTPVEAQAVPDQPVATIERDIDGVLEVRWKNKKRCGYDLPVGTELFTRPTPAAADLHQQSHSVHLAGDEAGRTSVEGGVNAPQGWQPRETAPTDGTPVLICYPAWGVTGGEPLQAVAHYAEGEWRNPEPADNRDVSFWTPTHWMPLPAPPGAASPAAAAAPAYKCMSVTEDGRSCRSWCGDARCDAAAGVPTGWKLVPVEPTEAMVNAAWNVFDRAPESIWRSMLASSPVAPVGAPRERISVGSILFPAGHGDDEMPEVEVSTVMSVLEKLQDRLTPYAFSKEVELGLFVELAAAQGCELATDATKQQALSEQQVRDLMNVAHWWAGHPEDHDNRTDALEMALRAVRFVHLAATPIDQDFRRRPASSEAAPSAEGSE